MALDEYVGGSTIIIIWEKILENKIAKQDHVSSRTCTDRGSES